MTDSAETMRDLKHSKVFSFDDGLLTIKISGYGQEDGWGTLAFHERQIEIDADGFHCVEIAPSELREIRDFLNRVTKPGPSDPIPSQPDERPVCKLCGLEDGACICRSIPKQPQPDEVEAIAETIWRAEYRRATGRERSIPWSEVSSTDRERYRYVAAAILAMQAERRGVKP